MFKKIKRKYRRQQIREQMMKDYVDRRIEERRAVLVAATGHPKKYEVPLVTQNYGKI